MTTHSPSVTTTFVDLFRRYRWGVYGAWGAMIALLVIIEGGAILLEWETSSLWQGFRWTPQIVLLVCGVMIATISTPIYIAHGVTRRTAAIATALYTAVTVTLSALIMVAGFVAERGLFNVVGLSQFPDGVDLVASPTAIGATFVEFALLFLFYTLAGVTIGIGYYRLGALWGTVLMVLTSVPLVAAEAWQWRMSLVSDALPVPAEDVWATGALILVVLTTVMAALCIAMVRTVEIHNK